MALTAQESNYFSNLVNDVGVFLDAYDDLEDRFTEGFDRAIEQALPTFDFALEGDLNHLNEAALVAAFQTFQEIKLTMEANDRAHIAALLAVVQSWTR